MAGTSRAPAVMQISIPPDDEEDEEELEGFVDFTVATPWERFIASVEGLLRGWQAEGYTGLVETRMARALDGNPGIMYVEGEIPHGAKNFRLTLYFPDPVAPPDQRDVPQPAAPSPYSRKKAPPKKSPWELAAHPLQLWFGISEFMVIAPMTLSGVVLDSPEASMLLSSLAIAASNADSEPSSVPAFVPVHDPTRKSFVGFQHGPRTSPHGGSDYSCHFEADRIAAHVPQNLISLDGLYYLFAFKIIAELPSTVASVSPDVSVSLRIRYRIRYWGGRPMPRGGGEAEAVGSQGGGGIEGPGEGEGEEGQRRNGGGGGGRSDGVGEGEGDEEEDEYWAAMEERPWDEDAAWAHWHSVDDPVKGFEVVAMWREVHASSSSGMSQIEQLDATWADEWKLRALLVPIEDTSYRDDAPGFGGRLHSMLGAYVISSTAPYVEDFVQAHGMARRSNMSIPPPAVMERVIRDLFSPSAPPSAPPLAPAAHQSKGNHKPDQKHTQGAKGPGAEAKLEPLRSQRLREQQSNERAGEGGEGDAETKAGPEKQAPFTGKAAPADSLFGRLALHALRFGTCNIRSICALWLEFCRELRWHWEEAKLLPSMPTGLQAPNLGACLVHQKLQLLQECIRRQQQQQQWDLEERMKQAEMMHRIAAARLVGERVDELVRGTAFDDSRSVLNSASSIDAEGEGSVVSEEASLGMAGDGLGRLDSSSDYEDPALPMARHMRSASGGAPRADPERRTREIDSISAGGESSSSGAAQSEDERMAGGSGAYSVGGSAHGGGVGGGGGRQPAAEGRGQGSGPAQGRGARRVGAKAPAGDMWLLTVRRRMFIPHTQDPVLMTEDMIEEKERALEMLGETQGAREARARLQGDILLSDMSAFKAANPGAVLDDFVRWYSPQDWVEEGGGSDLGSSPASSARSSPLPAYWDRDDRDRDRDRDRGDRGDRDRERWERERERERERDRDRWDRERGERAGGAGWPPRGHLSERMQAEDGNLWQELWDEAEPEPAHEQRPIFHFSLEGEKILHYLDTLVPEALLSQLLCTAFSAAAHILGQAEGADIPPVAEERRRVDAMIASMWQWPDDQAPGNCTDERVEDLEVLFSNFERMEASVAAAASLWRRLGGCRRIVEELMACRAAADDIPCVTLLPARLGIDGDEQADEWEIVGKLFKEHPPESSSGRKGAWGGKRMGNLLLGHEPFEREVVFTAPAFAVSNSVPASGSGDGPSKGVPEGTQRGEGGKGGGSTSGSTVVRHQLYAKGSLDDLSLALKIAAQD